MIIRHQLSGRLTVPETQLCPQSVNCEFPSLAGVASTSFIGPGFRATDDSGTHCPLGQRCLCLVPSEALAPEGA